MSRGLNKVMIIGRLGIPVVPGTLPMESGARKQSGSTWLPGVTWPKYVNNT